MQEHCCGADKLFDIKEAQRKRRQYAARGPRGVTRRLINKLKPLMAPDCSLLDIGGGIGAIGLELGKAGLGSYTAVDASSGYQQMARDLFSERSPSLKTQFILGDYVEEQTARASYDMVALDKVICCYPQMEDLLRKAAGSTNAVLALSYPPSGWFSRLLQKAANLFLWLRQNPFRTYIHPEKKVHQILKDEGLEPRFKGWAFPWRLEIWQRQNVNST
mgnify:CR=1 FL=1